MNNYPKISIAMATFNGEPYLEKQLESIINQTYKNIEIIICDDCSHDKTIKIIENLIKENYPIKLYKNEKNLGYAKNFEKAIKLCESNYIALSDQDDIWESNKLELQIEYILNLEKKNINMPILVHSDLTMIDKNDNFISASYFKYRKYKLKKEKDLGHILGPCGIMGNTIMMNKNLKERILPFPSSIENHDYWISLMNELFGKRITLDEKLVNYRIHINNASNNTKKINKKINILTLLKNIYKRNLYVPYIDTKRFSLISYILINFELKITDKFILIKFQEYLSKNTSKFTKIFNVLKYSFYKRDIIYRLIFILALVIRKNISKKSFFFYNIQQIFGKKEFKGWGKKNSGKFAEICHKIFGGQINLLEDGFIKSVEIDKSLANSFSYVKDSIGIYYDATENSELENILNTYNFNNDQELMKIANEAIKLIVYNNISKYNHSRNVPENYFKQDEKKVLVIAQIEDDKSLKYGMTNKITLNDLINYALKENPNDVIYVKIHPDNIQNNNLNADFNCENNRCRLITEDFNSISLLKHFNKVYTRTSQMGFEAVLLGKECICFGMPFYAGWGVTDDRVICERRKRKLKVEEIFAGAYILYTKYIDPTTNKESNIIETIYKIKKMKEENESK